MSQTGRIIDRARIKAQVSSYLTDCHANRAALDPRYHPTLAGCLKVVYHADQAEAAAIKAAYNEATVQRRDSATQGGADT